MGTAAYKYSWTKMEVVAKNRELDGKWSVA